MTSQHDPSVIKGKARCLCSGKASDAEKAQDTGSTSVDAPSATPVLTPARACACPSTPVIATPVIATPVITTPVATSLASCLATRLDSARVAGLHRDPPRITSRQGAYVLCGGQRYVNFGSNDYLGLGTCPQWQATVSECFAAYAPSASSSRLITGNLAETEVMETAFAAHFGYAECLFFPSGYQANTAVVTALSGIADVVCYDKRIHASMAHALPRNGPQLVGYAHGDIDQLDRKLVRHARAIMQSGRRDEEDARTGTRTVQPVVLTESLFSMDGDVLDMPAFGAVMRRHGAFSIVDEAHALGVLGAGGTGQATHAACAGTCDGEPESVTGECFRRVSRGAENVPDSLAGTLCGDVSGPSSVGSCAAGHNRTVVSSFCTDQLVGADIVVGTLGKALGLFGAFVLMPQGFKEYLTNFAAPVMYSTAMPPAFAACACAAMERVAGMDAERAHLARLASLLREELGERLAGCPSVPAISIRGTAHILAVEVGDETRAVQMAQALRRRGLLVFAVRYPTVPQGRAILRISLTAAHGEEDVLRLADGIRQTVSGRRFLANSILTDDS